MSKLFVTSFTEGSNLKWGLFYLDYKNEQQILKSEWKPVAFDTEEEAFSKLTAIEAEHHREENAPAGRHLRACMQVLRRGSHRNVQGRR